MRKPNKHMRAQLCYVAIMVGFLAVLAVVGEMDYQDAIKMEQIKASYNVN